MEARGKGERMHSRASNTGNNRRMVMREQDYRCRDTGSQGSSVSNVLRMAVLFAITELNRFTCTPSGNLYQHGPLSFFYNNHPNKCEVVSYCSFNLHLHRTVAIFVFKILFINFLQKFCLRFLFLLSCSKFLASDTLVIQKLFKYVIPSLFYTSFILLIFINIQSILAGCISTPHICSYSVCFGDMAIKIVVKRRG